MSIIIYTILYQSNSKTHIAERLAPFNTAR